MKVSFAVALSSTSLSSVLSTLPPLSCSPVEGELCETVEEEAVRAACTVQQEACKCGAFPRQNSPDKLSRLLFSHRNNTVYIRMYFVLIDLLVAGEFVRENSHSLRYMQEKIFMAVSVSAPSNQHSRHVTSTKSNDRNFFSAFWRARVRKESLGRHAGQGQ